MSKAKVGDIIVRVGNYSEANQHGDYDGDIWEVKALYFSRPIKPDKNASTTKYRLATVEEAHYYRLNPNIKNISEIPQKRPRS